MEQGVQALVGPGLWRWQAKLSSLSGSLYQLPLHRVAFIAGLLEESRGLRSVHKHNDPHARALWWHQAAKAVLKLKFALTVASHDCPNILSTKGVIMARH
jgi:hypothetical protein